MQLTPEPPSLDRAIMAKICESPKHWSTFPCSLWFDTDAKVRVRCVNGNNYEFEDRDWQGRIIGKGIHGSLNALLIRFKHKNKASKRPLMELLTICFECRRELDNTNQLKEINKKTSGSLILSLSDKEVETVVSSKAIIMEGPLMNVIKTIGIDGESKKWDMLRLLVIC